MQPEEEVFETPDHNEEMEEMEESSFPSEHHSSTHIITSSLPSPLVAFECFQGKSYYSNVLSNAYDKEDIQTQYVNLKKAMDSLVDHKDDDEDGTYLELVEKMETLQMQMTHSNSSMGPLVNGDKKNEGMNHLLEELQQYQIQKEDGQKEGGVEEGKEAITVRWINRVD